MQRFLYIFQMMLRDNQGAVLVEYTITLLLLGVIGYVGFLEIALAVSGMYHSDTNGMKNISSQLWQTLP